MFLKMFLGEKELLFLEKIKCVFTRKKKKEIDIFIYRIQLYVGILNPTPYAKGRKNIKEDDSYENQC